MTDLTFRLATHDDLIDIVRMLTADPLGALRENAALPLSARYVTAFNRIQQDENQELTVAELNGEIVGTFQLTFIQYLTHQGGLRAQIEAVRAKSTHRGKGIGTAMFRYAIDRASQRGCYVLQLTTDKQRPKAIQFYEMLGFTATHEGMKLTLHPVTTEH
ncbi:MAG: GNAT family N-acetyltransferase [Bacteroidetes bacterium]|nr:GNAT family N-acetyltransferase [Fibrella sp.]